MDSLDEKYMYNMYTIVCIRKCYFSLVYSILSNWFYFRKRPSKSTTNEGRYLPLRASRDLIVSSQMSGQLEHGTRICIPPVTVWRSLANHSRRSLWYLYLNHDHKQQRLGNGQGLLVTGRNKRKSILFTYKSRIGIIEFTSSPDEVFQEIIEEYKNFFYFIMIWKETLL